MTEEDNKKKNRKTLKIVGAIIIGLIFIGLVSPKTETKTNDEPAKTERANSRRD